MRNLLSIQLSAGGGKQVFSKHNQWIYLCNSQLNLNNEKC
jgi:hypothetical protein